MVQLFGPFASDEATFFNVFRGLNQATSGHVRELTGSLIPASPCSLPPATLRRGQQTNLPLLGWFDDPFTAL